MEDQGYMWRPDGWELPPGEHNYPGWIKLLTSVIEADDWLLIAFGNGWPIRLVTIRGKFAGSADEALVAFNWRGATTVLRIPRPPLVLIENNIYTYK